MYGDNQERPQSRKTALLKEAHDFKWYKMTIQNNTPSKTVKKRWEIAAELSPLNGQ